MINTNNFSKFLLESLPEFKIAYDENLKDNEGEILPYVIFGELTRFFINEFEKENFKLCDKIQKYLLDLLSQNDLELNNLVSFGFLENLHQAENDYEKIKNNLNPILSNILNEIEI